MRYTLIMDDVSSVELGRELSRRRQRYDKTCEVCSVSFKGLNWSRYCTPKCRQVAWLSDHRAEWNEKRRLARARRARSQE